MEIRPAVLDDLDQLVPMLVDMGFVDDEAALRARFPQFCSSKDHPFLVADDGGTLLGMRPCMTWASNCAPAMPTGQPKLDDLYTAPDHRRRGVARALMAAVESWAAAKPVRYVFWYANQGEAGAAYKAMGYQPEESGQEGFDFYEIDLGDPARRQPHPLRGS